MLPPVKNPLLNGGGFFFHKSFYKRILPLPFQYFKYLLNAGENEEVTPVRNKIYYE